MITLVKPQVFLPRNDSMGQIVSCSQIWASVQFSVLLVRYLPFLFCLRPLDSYSLIKTLVQGVSNIASQVILWNLK